MKLKFISIFISLIFIYNCSDDSNAIYIIEDSTNSTIQLDFYGRRKSMYIHSDKNQILISANLKLKENSDDLESVFIELYDSMENKLENVPRLQMRSEDIGILNSNRSKFSRVGFIFDYSNFEEKDFNKRYQKSRSWISKAGKFLINAKFKNSTLSNLESDSGSTSNKAISLTELVKLIEPSVFLVMNNDINGNTQSIGTGFFIDSNRALSNHHVFEGGSKWFIKLIDGRTFEVESVLKQSKENDFIIFQIKTDLKFPYLKISNKEPEKGEDIVVLGNPNGLESTISRGIVSAIREKFIQIDAAISPGSSGSPVLNMRGEVLGIATLKVVNCENCNLAYKISVIEE